MAAVDKLDGNADICQILLEASISLKIFWLPKFENRGCITENFPYGSFTVRMALGYRNCKTVTQLQFSKFGKRNFW